ncbi:hypothetical protein WICPIJ_001791 [Wickerhamomyces pijperi]|uniref:DUF676 domain-containing protein n=1 Tax=Wickerhamomyces pijperi TaxID=599730 RepID=A0A9P8QD35_WICPI|nr:hypothetical protein WICPIJ_001791 [Wickerhamomyces pijperi]
MNESTPLVNSTKKAHLFVLVHGLWGGASHLKSIEQVLDSVLGEDEKISDHILTIKPKTSALLKTYDGIEIISKRMLLEVLNYIIEVQTEGYVPDKKKDKTRVKVSKISFVGYSLGGLVARHLIGQFESLGLFEHIEPYYYTSFASPHLGTWFFEKQFMNVIGSNLLGIVGAELFIEDGPKMLLQLSEGVFYQGLQRFKKRFAIANVRHDRSVAFYTSYITDISPFDAKWDEIKLGYEDASSVEVRGDIASPAFVDLNQTRMKTEEEIRADSVYSWRKVLKYSGIVAAMVVILPWWVPFVFTVTATTTVLSHAFVKYWYRGPTEAELRQLIKDLTKEVEEVIASEESYAVVNDQVQEALSETEGHDNIRKLRERVEETTESIIESAVNVREFNCKKTESGSIDSSDTNLRVAMETPEIKIQDLKFTDLSKFLNPDLSELKLLQGQLQDSRIKLPLDSTRLEILRNLNSLAWYKFAVHLDVLNAHNSVVARRGLNKANAQGISVVLNWSEILRDDLVKMDSNV